MTTNFELAAPFAPTLPLSLIADVSVAPSLTRLPRARMTNPCPARQTEVRLELIASIRRRIASGAYRVSAMQLADSMFEAIYSA